MLKEGLVAPAWTSRKRTTAPCRGAVLGLMMPYAGMTIINMFNRRHIEKLGFVAAPSDPSNSAEAASGSGLRSNANSNDDVCDTLRNIIAQLDAIPVVVGNQSDVTVTNPFKPTQAINPEVYERTVNRADLGEDDMVKGRRSLVDGLVEVYEKNGKGCELIS